MDEKQLRDSLASKERRNVDFKAPMEFSGDGQCSLTADIVALANTPGGGWLVIGIEDGTHTIVGITDAEWASFDKTKIGQFIADKVTEMPRFEVLDRALDGKRLAVIAVSEFEQYPIILQKELPSRNPNKFYGKPGDVLFRTEAAQTTPIRSATDMRLLLDAALSRRSEHLLTQFKQLLKGATPPPPISPTERIRSALPGFRTGPTNLIAAHPKTAVLAEFYVVPSAELTLDPGFVKKAVRNTSVNLRGGWSFPYWSEEESKIKSHSVVTLVDWRSHVEYWEAAYTGIFAWTGLLYTDLLSAQVIAKPPPPARVIDVIDLIYSITERTRFAASYAAHVDSPEYWLCHRVSRVDNRELGTFDPRYSPPYDKRAAESEISFERWVSHAELVADWQAIAREALRRIFAMFQWTDPSDEMLRSHQERLLSRKS